jgi:putative nucleotidyltransferase with HDIG domain
MVKDDTQFPPSRPFRRPTRRDKPPPTRAPSLRVLAQSRDRLLEAIAAGSRPSDVVGALEADPGLLLELLRRANKDPSVAGTVGSARRAVDVLGADAVAGLAKSVPTVDPLRLVYEDARRMLAFRAHALTVLALARRIAAELGAEQEEDLAAAALLHDVGKLALTERLDPAEGSPEARRAAERKRCGTDHAELGGWLIRRWRLPERVAIAVEHHHTERLGLATIVRLADLVVHAREGHPVEPEQLITTAMVAGLPGSTLSLLLRDPPFAAGTVLRRPQPVDLSPRELEVLRGLNEGRVPKQIAVELGVAEATVRSHLRRIYQRLGAADRTQAVLIARDRGWVE